MSTVLGPGDGVRAESRRAGSANRSYALSLKEGFFLRFFKMTIQTKPIPARMMRARTVKVPATADLLPQNPLDTAPTLFFELPVGSSGAEVSVGNSSEVSKVAEGLIKKLLGVPRSIDEDDSGTEVTKKCSDVMTEEEENEEEDTGFELELLEGRSEEEEEEGGTEEEKLLSELETVDDEEDCPPDDDWGGSEGAAGGSELKGRALSVDGRATLKKLELELARGKRCLWKEWRPIALAGLERMQHGQTGKV
jgi:hypothetical protein